MGRLLRRFAPRNDEKEGKAFCNKKNVIKKSLRFSKVSACKKNILYAVIYKTKIILLH